MHIFRWLVFFFLASSAIAEARPNLKLPFVAGESWTLTRGYNTGSHRLYQGVWNDDRFALDFVEPGCRSWGKAIVAAADGFVEIVSNRNDNGYGKNLFINHGDGYKTRYAHLDSISVTNGQFVAQGQELGRIGNTGNVEGVACREHPGMHLHFVFLRNGVGELPESLSGYTNLRAGSVYQSDNQRPAFLFTADTGANPHACGDEPTGGVNTNWIYSCADDRDVFEAGETIWGLFWIDEIFSDHRFKVRTYRDGAFQWEWTTGWNDVDERWGWRRAYFWPRLDNTSPGLWEFDFFVDTGSGFSAQPVASTAFEVEEQEPFHFSDDGGANPYTCGDEPTGGAHTGWVYSCRDSRNVFRPGERVYGFLRIDDVFIDHCFLVKTYRNGVHQWQWEWCNTGVDPVWGWERAYFWTRQDSPQTGSWEFRFFVNAGSGYPANPLAIARFIVR